MVERPLLLFDMDGTLITLKDTSEYPGVSTGYTPYVSLRQRIVAIAHSQGVPMEEYSGLNRMALFWNRTREYAESKGFSDTETRILMDAISEPFMRHEDADHERSFLIPGTIETLEALQNQGYRLGLVTTAARMAYERLANSPKFGRFGRYFQHSITRDECDYVKPNPEPISRILLLFGDSEFVYVGDSDHDAQAVKAAGGVFILMNTKGYDDKTVDKLNPHAIIYSLTELSQVLQSALG